jgi:FMN phosphatase YigB (HAD superfamily)
MKYNCKNTKIVFDFHNVIVTEPFNTIYDLKKLLSWDMIPNFNKYLPIFVYYLMYNLICYSFNFTLFKYYCEKYQQEKLYNFILNVGNSFELINETTLIIKNIKEKGYEIDLASNIDHAFLDDIFKSHKHENIRKILELFDNIIVTGVSVEKRSIRKPNIKYFKDYLSAYNSQNKTIIFIDDCKYNIEASIKCNMIGIKFTTPNKLSSNLSELMIL